MTTPNPYAPPRTALSDVKAVAPQSKVPQYIVAALVGLQLVGSLRFSEIYLELVRTGAVHPLALLFGFSGSLCLYAGAILAAINGVRGRILFLLAAVGLALSVRYWIWFWPGTTVAAFGAVLGVAGWWITRRALKA